MLLEKAYQPVCQPHPCSECWGPWLCRLCGSSTATRPGVWSKGPSLQWARLAVGSKTSTDNTNWSVWQEATVSLIVLLRQTLRASKLKHEINKNWKWRLLINATIICQFVQWQAPGTLGSPRMAMPTESFLFWPPLKFLAWAVMIFSKSRSLSTLLTYEADKHSQPSKARKSGN